MSLAAILVPVLALVIVIAIVAFFAWVLLSLRRVRNYARSRRNGVV